MSKITCCDKVLIRKKLFERRCVMLPVIAAFGVAMLIARAINSGERSSSSNSSSSKDDSDSGSFSHDSSDGPSPDDTARGPLEFNPSDEAGDAFRSVFGDDNK